MDRLAAMTAFAAVVEAGSFVQAAERRGLSTTVLSRRVAELEQHLGARLLNRTTRRLSLTESGQAFYERCVQLLAELEDAERAASATAAAPRGTLRLTCSLALGVQRLAPAMASFAARYPDVKFHVSASDQVIDLVEEGFDLAVRVGEVRADSLVARRLGETQIMLAAAPAYLKRHGTPRDLADLATRALLTYAYSSTANIWRLTDAAGVEHSIRASGALHANSGDLLAAAAAAGLGIVREPDFILAPYLADGRLRRILPELHGPRGPIWAVYPSRRHLSAKVRLFVDHLAQVFAGP
jgi:DNA-binding transcriptional LysR family regulator